MKKNERGFGVVEGLLILVIVGLIGFVGWYVWQANRKEDVKNQESSVKTKGEPQAQTEAEAKKCSNKHKAQSSKKIGIAFCYPELWAIELNDKPMNHVVGTATITSPDFKEEKEGFGGSKTGSKVYISVFKISELSSGYTSVGSILDGSEQGKEVYTEVKPAKIAGISGASFIDSYEGPSFMTNMFEYKGSQYSIILEEDIDGPRFNDNVDVYKKIVASFELLP